MMNRSIVRLTLTILLSLLLPAVCLAQERQTGPAREKITREIAGRTVTIERPLLVPATEANFEQYRSDLLAILAAQKETAKMLRLQGADEMLEAGMRHVASMKYSDYAGNVTAFPELGLLKDATTQHKDAIAKALADGTARLTSYTIPTDPFPGAQYSLNLCPLNPQPPEVAFTSGLLALAATLARDLAHDICLQIVSAFVAGGNTSLACIAVTVIYVAALIIDYPIQFCDEDTTAGEIKGGYLRAEYVKDELNFSIANDNTNKAMLSTQLTNAENHIVTNDNNNKAALSSQTATFQTLAVRTAIERNLAADPVSIAGVGLFQLPASKGGYLELARQILIDTYNAQLSAAGAGVVIYNPSSDLALGATFTAQGKYREAYYYYRKGFRSVVKYP